MNGFRVTIVARKVVYKNDTGFWPLMGIARVGPREDRSVCTLKGTDVMWMPLVELLKGLKISEAFECVLLASRLCFLVITIVRIL